MATVQICDPAGQHHGQGLLLNLEDEGSVVLTCHHVVARLGPDTLNVAIRQTDGSLGPPIRASYDQERSRPAMDAVILRVDAEAARAIRSPLLHALNPEVYAGSLQATGLSWLRPVTTFGGKIEAADPLLPIPVEVAGPWPEPPATYVLPFAFRLTDPTQAGRGISGSVIVCEDGVLGLANAARAETPEHGREVYVIPLVTWAAGWPALADCIELFVDQFLDGAAIVKRSRRLNVGVGQDITVAKFRSEVYVTRAGLEQQARAALEAGGVVMVGRPKSGKTRLGCQIVQTLPDAVIVVPRADRPPPSFERAGLFGRDILLFLDELDRLPTSAQPLEWRRQLEGASGRPCRLICTSRDGQDWRRVQDRHAELVQLVGPDGIVFTSRVDTQQGSAGEDLSAGQGEDLARMLRVPVREFRRRFDGTPGSLTLDLTDMRRRYEHLCDEVPLGISSGRLLEAAKLLHLADHPHPREGLLRVVAERVVGENHTIGRDAWTRLKRRTEEEGFGIFDASNEFRTYRSYLEECVRYQPEIGDVEALIAVLREKADSDGLSALGLGILPGTGSPLDFGYDANRRLARDALQAVFDTGDRGSLAILCGLIDDKSVAVDLCRKAIAEGDSMHWITLGGLLREAGQLPEAEDAFLNANSLGYTQAGFVNLAFLYEQSGRQAEAEAMFRKAAEDYPGIPNFKLRLAKYLLRQPGRELDADPVLYDFIRVALPAVDQAVLDRAADVGLQEDLADAIGALAAVRAAQPGHADEAEGLFHVALDKASERQVRLRWASLRGLGRLLAENPERQDEAKNLLEEAVEAGNELCRDSPDNNGLRLEVSRDNFALGWLLSRRPDQAEKAERALQAALRTGSPGAAVELGLLLSKQPGRDEEAVPLLRDGVTAGDSRASPALARVLFNLGRLEEALTVLRAASAAGDSSALGTLAVVLSYQPGREAEAETAFTEARAAGQTQILEHEGDFLSRQPGREDDAEQAYRDAIAAGYAEVGVKLEAFLANRAEQETA